MKYRIALAITLLRLAPAATLIRFVRKRAGYTKEISYAEKHNNQRRIEGLNKALSEVRANCTDSKLRAEHQKKIAEQKKR